MGNEIGKLMDVEVQQQAILVAAATLTIAFIWEFIRRTANRKRIAASGKAVNVQQRSVTIVFASQRGAARQLANKLYSRLCAWNDHSTEVFRLRIVDAKDYEVENLNKEDIILFVVSTYSGGRAPPASGSFEQLFTDLANDFRVPRDFMSATKSAVFGLGDLNYASDFNKFAKTITDGLRSLGSQSLTSARFVSEARIQTDFASFTNDVVKKLSKLRERTALTRSGALIETSSDEEADEEKSEKTGNTGDDEDVEDMVENPNQSGRRELLYPKLRESLTKQGYSLIGTHSGVKLCRWTKSMLRGRGGCYKHTFYNISSFQCMEMTPSLACANKCVFCWRHHTNPVTREFTWTHDSPQFLIENALLAHRNMIRQMKGVPGVVPDRFQEAMTVKHCALSLVGEPIIYPEINEYMRLLHERHISTFMVTNAQFPDRIEQLTPVTQLYVSIDAATKESLREIDRPIFEDFWERYIACITALSRKPQRTVFRLTLVQHYNMTELREYVKLVRLGNPDFIEVKGVTYCGTNDASPLTMKNVPYHQQVVDFCLALQELLGDEYQLACEHAHSCCMLMAKKKFLIGGIWHTWIDYDKFFQLVQSGRTDFTALEYAAPTPAWATFNSAEKGFDPLEVRHERRGAKKNEPITSGC